MEREKLAELYHDQNNFAFLGSKDALKRSYLQKYGKNPNAKILADFLLGERGSVEYKPRKIHFARRMIKKKSVWEGLQADLGDLQALSRYNNGFSYVFLIIDNFSKVI